MFGACCDKVTTAQQKRFEALTVNEIKKNYVANKDLTQCIVDTVGVLEYSKAAQDGVEKYWGIKLPFHSYWTCESESLVAVVVKITGAPEQTVWGYINRAMATGAVRQQTFYGRKSGRGHRLIGLR